MEKQQTIQSIKKFLSKSFLTYVLIILFFMSWYTPRYIKDANKLLNYVRYAFNLIAPCILFCMILYKKRFKPITFDILVCLITVCMFLSGIGSFERFTSTAKVAIRVFTIPLAFKIILESKGRTKTNAINAVSFYFLTICIINTLQIIAVGGEKHGHYFFLGSDNGIADMYFIQVFILYVRKVYLKLRHSVMLYLAAINTALYAFILHVGAAALWVLAGAGILAIYYIIKRKWFVRIFASRNLIIADILVWLTLLVSQVPVFEKLINTLFFGKYSSLTGRVGLWKYFLIESIGKPLFGYGAGLSRYQTMEEGIEKWKLIGNCHNIFVETIYHYGYITFALILVLFFVTAYKLTKGNNRLEKTVLGVFFFLHLLHGLVEGGIAYSFFYLPILYYSEYLFCDFAQGEIQNDSRSGN